jgi:hypothetical protein
VVKVQVTVDDDVNVFRHDAGGGEIVEQLGGLSVKLDHPFGELVADARLDENILLAGSDEQRIEADHDMVVGVGGDSTRPHDLRDNSEQRATVERISAVGKGGEFEIAEREPVHGTSVTQAADETFKNEFFAADSRG